MVIFTNRLRDLSQDEIKNFIFDTSYVFRKISKYWLVKMGISPLNSVDKEHLAVATLGKSRLHLRQPALFLNVSGL